MAKHQTPIVSPGEVIQSELDARGWTQRQFADIIGKSRQFVNSLLRGRSTLTFDVAYRLEAAFDVPADTWLKMESFYRAKLEGSKIRAIRRGVVERARKFGAVAEKRAKYGK